MVGIVPRAPRSVTVRAAPQELMEPLFVVAGASRNEGAFQFVEPKKWICAMPANTPHNAPTVPVKTDKERDMRDAIIEDAAESDGADRDLVHGEGGTLGMPTKPEDLNQDD
jgi:hypothetical protein